MSDSLLLARGLTKTYRRAGVWGRPGEAVTALAGVDLDLQRGAALGLVGESGSGKSTLARILVRLVEPDAGSVRLDGVDVLALRGSALRRARRRIQIVFQDPATSLNPRLRIGAAVAEPIWAHRLAGREESSRRALALLERCGLAAELAGRYPHQLSGGQRQRVAIARALATEPEVLVADEPVSALDPSIQAQVLEVFADLRRELGLALLLISHDLAVIEGFVEHVAVLYRGRVVEQGPVAALLGAPLHPYTVRLVAAAPRIGIRDPGSGIRDWGSGIRDPGSGIRSEGRGGHPAAETTGTGCPYQPLCSRASARCVVERPLLVEQSRGRFAACHHAALDAGPVRAETSAAPRT